MMLLGKRALVTGTGSRGIGRAVALELAREGADLVVHALDQQQAANELADEIKAMGRRAHVLLTDLARPANARKLVADALAKLGHIDILVNNASTIVRKPFLELSDDDLDMVLAVNLKAYFACAQEVARSMVGARIGGRIIMISSVNQNLVVRDQSVYCASKGGVMQLAKAMAFELAPLGITVNLVAPGTIETDINRQLLADPTFRRLRQDPIPIGRIGVPEDIAAAVVFLSSDAAAYITGGTITVDGGLSLP